MPREGLSQRAGHPPAHLKALHGNLFDLKCFEECGYIQRNNLSDPLCPALAPAAADYPTDQTLPLLDPAVPLAPIETADLPHCPSCNEGLLRPGVVWFGESLDQLMLMQADNWIMQPGSGGVTAMLVIGTAATVYPAAGYVRKAKRKGAVVVVVNPDPDAAQGLDGGDFFFQGDAAEILPVLFEGLIGTIGPKGEILEG